MFLAGYKLKRARNERVEKNVFNVLGLPQSAVNGFHSGSVLLGAANAIEDDAKASSSDTIISMDGIQV